MPVRVIEVMFRVEVPLLFNCTLLVALVLPTTTLPNDTLAGLNATPGPETKTAPFLHAAPVRAKSQSHRTVFRIVLVSNTQSAVAPGQAPPLG